MLLVGEIDTEKRFETQSNGAAENNLLENHFESQWIADSFLQERIGFLCCSVALCC
jgi:hypothetical protein